jgi:CBS domain containing-hemolysin-like protein
MIIGFIFTIFLVFLSDFFVVAEFAIVKVRPSQIEVKKNTGKRGCGCMGKLPVNRLGNG